MAKSGEYENIFLNKGVNGIFDQKFSINRRPDITGITKGGRANLREIPSKTDLKGNLERRMEEVQNQLPPEMRGTSIVKEISKNGN